MISLVDNDMAERGCLVFFYFHLKKSSYGCLFNETKLYSTVISVLKFYNIIFACLETSQ